MQSHSLIWLCMKLPRTCLIWYYYFNEIESRLTACNFWFDIFVNLTLRFYFCLTFRNRSYTSDRSTLHYIRRIHYHRLMLKLYITWLIFFVFLLFSNFYNIFLNTMFLSYFYNICRQNLFRDSCMYYNVIEICNLNSIYIDAHNTTYTLPNIDL